MGGLIQIPGVDSAVERFLAPTFADSRFAHAQVSTGAAWVGLVIGAVVAVVGIALAYRIWVGSPGIALSARQRLAALYEFLSHRWYVDELIDLLIVRPSLWLGRLIDVVLDRTVIGGIVTGAPLGIVRAGSVTVRRFQTGFLRYYAATIVICLTAVAAYFLVSSP